MKLIIYGNGDRGTKLLREMCVVKNVKHEFRDIRHHLAEGRREWLAQMQERNHYTMPQVFRDDMSYVGDFEAAAAVLNKIPNARPMSPSAAY